MDTPYQAYPQGITRIDTGYLRPRFAASYLVQHEGRAAFIETGPAPAVPILLGALTQRGIDPGDVEAVIVTHVHLDHAGGAGELLQHLPRARLIVHPLGARHLIDPAKLVAGATAVYGQEDFNTLFRTVTPAPAERTHSPQDGEIFSLQGRPLHLIDTPGHARHHLCVWDPTSGGLFTGDAFGISYREMDDGQRCHLFPASTPVQFDPEQSHRSIDRLAALNPAWLFLTHFDRLPFKPELAADLHRQLELYTTLAESTGQQAGDAAFDHLRMGLQRLTWDRIPETIPPGDREAFAELLAMDWEINAQGLAVWLERRNKTGPWS